MRSSRRARTPNKAANTMLSDQPSAARLRLHGKTCSVWQVHRMNGEIRAFDACSPRDTRW